MKGKVEFILSNIEFGVQVNHAISPNKANRKTFYLFEVPN
jgi:hypothetical protein